MSAALLASLGGVARRELPHGLLALGPIPVMLAEALLQREYTLAHGFASMSASTSSPAAEPWCHGCSFAVAMARARVGPRAAALALALALGLGLGSAETPAQA
eukprot:CAMPEP_0118862210 /NCGR_PEP_ID=MMETSP1163-20130328/7490_1 /TAXON_ID=124430 /ORGANISM="Phaeomonas parva, Strain CCMP2877" /LENGTH=102 /DNA_ID=CAMNT_0006796091 /DNA_START=195 /DNA_END=505 /DNA_ORIENTATION=-